MPGRLGASPGTATWDPAASEGCLASLSCVSAPAKSKSSGPPRFFKEHEGTPGACLLTVLWSCFNVQYKKGVLKGRSLQFQRCPSAPRALF